MEGNFGQILEARVWRERRGGAAFLLIFLQIEKRKKERNRGDKKKQ
jgi:hypothetical protein